MTYPVCSVRPITLEDIEQVRQWRNLERIRVNMYNTDPIDADQQRLWFAGLEKDTTRNYFLFLQDDRSVGCLYYTNIREGTAQLGYYLGEERIWPGLGLLLELTALDYAFDRLGLDRLLAEVLEFNSGPQKIHALFGYEKIGGNSDSASRHGVTTPVIVFRYLREDWQARRSEILQLLPKQVREAAMLVKK